MKKVLVSLFFVALCSVAFAGPKEDLVGYYKADVPAIKKNIEAQVAAMPEEQQAMIKVQMEMMMKMFENMVVQFTETETSAWMMGQPKKSSKYTIEKIEGNVVTIKDDDSTNSFTVSKDAIEIATPGGNMRFVKIEEKEAKEMIAKSEAAAAEAKKNAEAEVPVEAPAEEVEVEEEGGMK